MRIQFGAALALAGQLFRFGAVARHFKVFGKGVAAEEGQAGADGADGVDAHAFFPAVQLVFVLGVVAQGYQVALEVHHQGLFDPALLVAQKHPDRPLFAQGFGELAMEHRPGAVAVDPRDDGLIRRR